MEKLCFLDDTNVMENVPTVKLWIRLVADINNVQQAKLLIKVSVLASCPKGKVFLFSTTTTALMQQCI